MSDPEVLAAFREVTGWSDERVLHYVACQLCEPICGYEEWDCRESPVRRGEPAPGPLGGAMLQVWQPVIRSLLTSRVPDPVTLPKACYRTASGLPVHVRPCTC